MFGSTGTRIRRDGDTLTARLPRANPPLLWRFDLQHNHSFTLALRGADGDWELGITSLKGEFYPVARFASRADADEAFFRLQKRLMKRPPRKLSRIMLFGVGIVLGFLVGSFWGHISSGRLPIPSAALSPALVAPYVTPSAAVPHLAFPRTGAQDAGPFQPMQQGVPLPADEVLKPPEQ
jgi:hypothetical protein